MSIGANIQFLRKQKKITQEQLADIMNVSRQTVSRWESDEVTPELNKLVELSKHFSCKLDSLVCEDIVSQTDVYSDITIKKISPFKMARYVIVSPNPEDDVNNYMYHWADNCGLLKAYPDAKRIGWDFPYVSSELQNRFGLRGYVAAYILPQGFETDFPGVEYADQLEADYAVITVYDPFSNACEKISGAYKNIMKHLGANNFREFPHDNILSCFEYVYEKDGMTCMDVHINVDSVTRSDAFTYFN